MCARVYVWGVTVIMSSAGVKDHTGKCVWMLVAAQAKST